jgi:hypothetical protein
MKTTYLDDKMRLLTARRERLIERFADAARAGKNTLRISTDIRRTNDFLSSLGKIVAENAPDATGRRYVVSSLFLHDCFRKLTADGNEQFFFVTGAEIDGTYVLDQGLEFAHERRTRVGVEASMPSTHRLLIRLEEFGHKFLAHFHSHPGNGPGSTRPSGTDENFQKRLEAAGHVAVMAIFSRDGYVRFKRMDGQCEVEIYGEGVESYAPDFYRLTNID